MSSLNGSVRHPHEPEQSPLVDGEGRCLVCALSAAKSEAARLRKVLDTIGVPESYRRAVAILADEAEAYLSAVGDEDDASERIGWAVRRVREGQA
jgi:hypothetical protein